MKEKVKKSFKLTMALFLTLGILTSLILINNYLNTEKLLFYGTGIDKKAIINSTWNMSYKEVERANKVILQRGLAFTFAEPILNELLDESRISIKTSKLNLWSYEAELQYQFFDDRLFRYTLLGKITQPERFDSVAVKNLEASFGVMKRDSTPYDGTFQKDFQSIKYYQFTIENSEDETENRFLIEVTYLPLFEEITNVAANEQNSIFK